MCEALVPSLYKTSPVPKKVWLCEFETNAPTCAYSQNIHSTRIFELAEVSLCSILSIKTVTWLVTALLGSIIFVNPQSKLIFNHLIRFMDVKL